MGANGQSVPGLRGIFDAGCVGFEAVIRLVAVDVARSNDA